MTYSISYKQQAIYYRQHSAYMKYFYDGQRPWWWTKYLYMDLLFMGKGNCCSIVCVGHIHVMMESALYTRPILAFSVLPQLYWEYIFQYWPSSRLWCGSFENSPQGGLLMSPLNFLSTRSYKIWPKISPSAMGYKEIVYLEHTGATLATHEAGKALGLSASSAISRQDQARSSVRMHLVRAIVMPKPYCHPS